MASLIFGMAGKLLTQLSSTVLLQDVRKYWGSKTKDELSELFNSVSTIKAVLTDADEKQRTNHEVRDWLKKIRLVFYDVEDLLQEFHTEALKLRVKTENNKAKKVHLFFSFSNPIKCRLEMGRKVKLLREGLDAIASECKSYDLIESRKEEVNVIRSERMEGNHLSGPFIEEVNGRHEDKRSIKRHLFEDAEDNVSVISIIGIAGMGKTTLARSLYNDQEIKDHFELRIWRTIPRIFDIKLICEKLIESATKKKCEGLPMGEVRNMLKRIIYGRMFLVVLDDVWSGQEMEWFNLKDLLTCGASGSKILITSRSKRVASYARSNVVYSLRGLSFEESWTLFKQVAFQRGVDPESARVRVTGNRVVALCVGVPLSIKIIGSMFGPNWGEYEWLNLEYDLRRITQDIHSEIPPYLRLSYESLSASLKRCFAYCAVFPRDYKIHKTTLIWLWMAQGLIPYGESRRIEDVAEKYFMELIDRSFFQECETGETGDNCCYRLHNLVYDLLLSTDGNDCCKVGWDDNVVVNETIRHAWVTAPTRASIFDATKLRTLVVKTQEDITTYTSGVDLFSLKHLRVLDLAMSKITCVPLFVGGLSHLHYLDLSGNTLDSIPESVCNLYNLQTLILTSCKNLRELPRGTKNLVSLRHLDVTGCDGLRCMPHGLGKLTCLQTLTDFVMLAKSKKCAELVELKSLVNLRGTLTIRNLSAYRAGKHVSGESYHYPDLLIHHTFIDYLWLEWSLEDGVEAEEELQLFESLQPHRNLKKLYFKDYAGSRFPSWMDTVNIQISLSNIVYIGITNCKSCKHLPPFGLLPYLEHLFLWDVRCLDYLYNEEDQWHSSTTRTRFPSLRKLDLFNMPQLMGLAKGRRTGENMEFVDSHNFFPVLVELYICSCPLFFAGDGEEGKQLQSLKSLRSVHVYNSLHRGSLVPGLQYIPNLRSLTLERCENMETLPDWIGNLKSLQEIHLKYCESLASIPDSFQGLTSLKRLTVRSCPQLRKRCQKETGDDWPNIAHIPYVRLR